MTRKCTSSKKYVKQLISYTTAAGIGAFGSGESADGAIVYIDIPDATISTVPPDPNSNFENLLFLDVETGDYGSTAMGGNEIQFRARYRNPQNTNGDGTAGAGDRSASSAGAQVLTKVVQGYYLDPFLLGESIGPAAVNPTGYAQIFMGGFPYKYGGYSYSGGPFVGYLGFKFTSGPDTHFGWVEVETDAGGESAATITIKSLAYEGTPDTAILAGVTVPEPGTLALLAAGAGALAMKRKKQVA